MKKRRYGGKERGTVTVVGGGRRCGHVVGGRRAHHVVTCKFVSISC